jgi:hypothetical protein
MIKAFDEDNGKRTTPPSPLPETLAEVFISDGRKVLLRLTAFEREVNFSVFSRKRGLEKMVAIVVFEDFWVVDEREGLRYSVLVILRGEI